MDTKIRPTVMGLRAAAVITGTFLSGAMMGLSLMTIPLFLDTNAQAAHMLHQWARLYHYGHILAPSLCIITFLMYAYIARNMQTSGKPWISYAMAGAVTTGMIPFTLLVMVPTNNTLFRLDDEIRIVAAATTLENVRVLVTRWGRMHLMRSLFPLAGAALGFDAFLKDVAA